jgi:hypothetical protein
VETSIICVKEGKEKEDRTKKVFKEIISEILTYLPI